MSERKTPLWFLEQLKPGYEGIEDLLSDLHKVLEDLGFDYVSIRIQEGEALLTWEKKGRKVHMRKLPLQGSTFNEVIRGGLYRDNSIGKYSSFYDERKLAEEGFKSYAVLPLSLGEKRGSLNIASKLRDAFSQKRLQLLKALSNYISSIIISILMKRMTKESQNISKLLFERSADIVLIIDSLTGRIVDANSNAEDVSNYSRDELLRIEAFTLFGRRPTETLLRKAVKEGNIGPIFLRLHRKDGDERLLQVKMAALSLNGFSSILLTGEDVTERFAIESSYKDVVESVSDIIFTMNGRGELIDINDEVEKLLGHEVRELKGSPFGRIIYENDYQVFGSALSMLSPKNDSIRDVELRLINKNGKPRWFEMSARAYFDSSNNLVKLTGILKDIDDRKTIAEYEPLVSALLLNSSDAVIGLDKMGMVTFWNKGAETIFGYTKEEAVGRSARFLYPDGKVSEFDEMIKKLDTFGSVNFTGRRVRKDGEPIHVSSFASVLKDADGRKLGYLEIIRDMTAQKKAEESERARRRLQERYKQLRALNEMKSIFVSNVSHELKTPLTSIHGYSSLLLDGMAGKLSPEQRNYISIIHSETERLTKLINDLLDLSRLERGKFKMNFRYFNIHDLIEKTSCASLAKKKGLYVRWNIADDVPPIYGDPARISQVLINLISNAIKFTEKGGVTINISKKGRNFVLIEVIDTGCGIPEDAQKRLFKRFYQVPKSNGMKREGTGLGLAISREIVKLHGGRMGVESKVGEGSRFYFTLRTQPKKSRRKAGPKV